MRTGAVTRARARDRRRRHHRAVLQLRRRRRARRQRARRAGRARSERAGHRLSRARRKARLDRALLVEPMRRWRDRICRRRRPVRHADRRHPAAWVDRGKRARDRVGRRRRSLPPDAPRRPRRSRAIRTAICACSPARSARGTASVHLVGRARAAARGRRPPVRRASSSATAPSARPPSARRAACPAITFTGALPHDRLPAALAHGGHRRRAVRSDAARAAAAGLLLVAAQDLRVHGGRVCRSSRRPCRACAGSSSTAARACSTIPTIRAALDRALVALADPAGRGGAWARPRARGSSAISAGPRTARRSTRRLRALVRR